MSSTESTKFRITRKVLTRIFSNIQLSTTTFYNGTACWEWTAGLTDNGYGQFRLAGIHGRRAHRIIYEVFVAPVPQDLMCDHLCRNVICVNPIHIEPVTNQINQLRGVGFPATNKAKTHCVNNHELAAPNIRYVNGKRVCRLCGRKAMREYRERHS